MTDTATPIMNTPLPRSKEAKQRNPRGVYQKVEEIKLAGQCVGTRLVWYVRYADASGKLRREKAGTKSNAIALYRKRKTEVLQGIKLPEKLRRKPVSFADIADFAEAALKRKKLKREKESLARLEKFKIWFGSKEAASIEPEEIEAQFNRQGWAKNTFKHHKNDLWFVFYVACKARKRWPEFKSNPVDYVDWPKSLRYKPRKRELSCEEEKRLRQVITSRYPEHELKLDFALHTGLRKGNQYQLTWDMVDLRSHEIHIPEEITKNGEPLDLPLNGTASRVLAIRSAGGRGSGRVFTSTATGEPLSNSKHWFKDAVTLADIKDFRWHDLRRTFATRLRAKDVRIEDIGALLGHKPKKVTEIYARPSMKNLHAAVATISNHPIDTPTDTRNIAPQLKQSVSVN